MTAGVTGICSLGMRHTVLDAAPAARKMPVKNNWRHIEMTRNFADRDIHVFKHDLAAASFKVRVRLPSLP